MFFTDTDRAIHEAGNQTQSNENSFIRNYRYDAAGRLYDVKDGSNTLLATYSYGGSNQRLQLVESGLTTLYAWEGGSVIAEYNGANNGMAWTKSYVYLGGRLLATEAPLTVSTTETKYHHPDRLGTRLVTNTSGAVVSENISLPFGATIVQSSGRECHEETGGRLAHSVFSTERQLLNRCLPLNFSSPSPCRESR